MPTGGSSYLQDRVVIREAVEHAAKSELGRTWFRIRHCAAPSSFQSIGIDRVHPLRGPERRSWGSRFGIADGGGGSRGKPGAEKPERLYVLEVDPGRRHSSSAAAGSWWKPATSTRVPAEAVIVSRGRRRRTPNSDDEESRRPRVRRRDSGSAVATRLTGSHTSGDCFQGLSRSRPSCTRNCSQVDAKVTPPAAMERRRSERFEIRGGSA